MEMIKKEWQAIYKNKILLISFIVISFIPILYASFFLKSVWDPYGKTEDLPVAVVNEDEEVEYSGKTLNVGQELVDQLKEDDNLNWQFVSAKEAQKGLKNNDYYMIVTLPEDFSSNAATVMDDIPQKMNIEYETNGGLNYLGEVVGETAMKQLKSEVSQKVTEVYAKAIFDQLAEVSDGFSDAADGAGKLDDGAVKLADGSKTLAENLDTLAKSTITFSDGEETFTSALSKYLEGTVKIDNGLSTLNTGVNTLGEKVPALADGVGQLEDGSNKLSNGIQSYTGGVSKLADGAGTLAGSGNTLTSGVDALEIGLTGGTTQLQSGASQITAGLTQMSEQLGTQINGSEEQLKQLDAGLTQINDGLQQLNTALNGSTGASFDAEALKGQLTEIGTNDQAIGDAASAIVTDVGGINNNLSELGNSLNTDVKNQLAENGYDEGQIEQITGILQNALGQNVNLSNAGNSASDIALQLGTIGTSTQIIAGDTQALGTALTTLSTTLNSAEQLSASVQQLSAGSAQAIPGAQQAISSLSNGLGTVKTALDGQLIPGMQQLEGGLDNLKTGESTGFSKLSDGMKLYTAGVGQINDGVQTLNSNSDNLNSGAATLHDGLGKLNMNVPVLLDGAQKLVSGTAELKAGSTELVSKNGELLSGQKKLLDASEQLKTGSGKLADGGNTLLGGLNTLKEGSGELASALSEGAEKVNDVHTTDKTAEMISEPNKITQQKYSEVPNYGHALAPYVLSLALYVGCLVFNFIYPIRKTAVKGKSAVQWWLSKVSVGFVAATAMALIEGSIMLALGLEPQNIPQYFIVGLTSAYAYMFLIMFLAMAFDNPGRFVAMVLLILQLAGSGGTFPMPLTDKFFRVIHEYLPMTHSIYGFREAISSGLKGGTFGNNAALLLGLAVVSVGLLLIVMKILTKHHKDGVSQLDDNQKLLDDNYDYPNGQEA
jgi:putative membrane protein